MDPKVTVYLIGDWICGIFDNVELLPLVHCTYLAHLKEQFEGFKSRCCSLCLSKGFAYPIFLDSVILAELHCDVSPKSHLSGIYICI